MLNEQPAEKPDLQENGSVDIVGIFLTLQGECEYAGMPSIFIRLAGCSLACSACDTNYTTGRNRYPVVDIIKMVKDLRPCIVGKLQTLIVLTGGEPLRQNVGPLIYALCNNSYKVQIETNGIHPPPDIPIPSQTPAPFGLASKSGFYTLVCSPKTPTLNPKLEGWIDAYKYVLAAEDIDPEDGLPTVTLGSMRPARPFRDAASVWVQPQDDQDMEKNIANMRAAIDSSIKFGYRLSIQTHKLAGLP